MLMCDECGMWRLVCTTRKLKAPEIRKLRQTLDDLSFSCKAELQDVGLPAEWEGEVYVKRMYCNTPIDRLYYSANVDDICIYCAGDVPPWSNTKEFYPQCEDCSDKPRITNVKKSWKLCLFLFTNTYWSCVLLSCTVSVLNSVCLCSYTVFCCSCFLSSMCTALVLYFA